ncbi:hypothetical protein EDD85DRAFT_837610 [Armillaria nabsnona]|nr:hypothetical protein EDD85DRAFT_837610 [Armillaria nabsnona]
MSRRVWPNAKVQIFQQHFTGKAVREHLCSAKLSTTSYKPENANKCFPFIDITLKLPSQADTKRYGGGKDPNADREDANIIVQLSTPRETLPPPSDEAELASMFCRCWFPRKINPLYRRRSKLALRTVRTAITLQKLHTQRRAHFPRRRSSQYEISSACTSKSKSSGSQT